MSLPYNLTPDRKMNQKTYRILVVDDHPIVTEGIVAVAGQLEGVECKGICQAGQLEQLPDAETFNLCIADLELPGINGFQLIDLLHKQMPKCRILIYTMHEEPWVTAKLSELNIDGAVSKNTGIDELSTAIGRLRNGKKYFSDAFTELDTEKANATHHPLHKLLKLSRREKEVLTYLSQGLSTPEISRLMFLSTNTVQTYRKRLMEKLEARNVVELVRKGKELF